MYFWPRMLFSCMLSGMMLEKIDELEAQSQADFTAIQDSDDLERFRIAYLGSKGAIKSLMALLKDVPKADKPAFGQRANALRQALQSQFQAKKSQLDAQPKASEPLIDLTEDGLRGILGKRHILSQTIDELIDVFGRMGFETATGPEVEDEYHNFIALNIPQAHPARDPLDNFYLSQSDTENPHLLRSQTSTVQIRVMEKRDPPIRIVSLGRVYRPDEHDATHYSMFHQIEGLYVDKNVSMVDMKSTLIQFAHAYFGKATEVRLRPSFFPFTEPSAELDVKMTVKGKEQWIEVGGCGMVDPNVFEAVGYDPKVWSGFAFGLGIERLAMRKYGIGDIRYLFENDIRFLKQF